MHVSASSAEIQFCRTNTDVNAVGRYAQPIYE